jgi:hypothetical protein
LLPGGLLRIAPLGQRKKRIFDLGNDEKIKMPLKYYTFYAKCYSFRGSDQMKQYLSLGLVNQISTISLRRKNLCNPFFIRKTLGVCFFAAILSTMLDCVVFSADSENSHQEKIEKNLVFSDLSTMSLEELSALDIAEMNLLCAQGLPGAENLDIQKSLQIIDKWSEDVCTNVKQYKKIFLEKPEEFHYSEGEFNMMMLITVLQQDCGVKYDEKQIISVNFKNSKNLFIHGMVDCSNGGTCASMPVLYVAVARRMNLPVKLVQAKGHLFCRWDDKKDKFNIEGSGRGFNRYDDNFYLKWPHPISKQELESGMYMKPLTPLDELASFLATRGHCLQDNGRLWEAREAYAMASRLVPKSPIYSGFLRNLTSNITPNLKHNSSLKKLVMF